MNKSKLILLLVLTLALLLSSGCGQETTIVFTSPNVVIVYNNHSTAR